MIKFLCLLSIYLFSILPRQAHAEETSKALPDSQIFPYRQHPQWLELVTRWPERFALYAEELGSYPWQSYGAVGLSTLALLPFDKDIHRELHDYSLRKKISRPGSQERAAFKFSLFGKPQGIFVPRSAVGVVWYFGDGLTWFLTSMGFTIYGYSHQDYRATQTAFQMFEAFSVSGPTVLAIKMATGRESPAESDSQVIRWQGFPGFQRYAANQNKYYAYPSGHTTAAVAAMTVIIENYSDYTWLVPLRAGMVGLLMLALIDVGSHWASDYPLALLLGYGAAQTAVQDARQRQLTQPGQQSSYRPGYWRWLSFGPRVIEQNLTLQSTWDF